MNTYDQLALQDRPDYLLSTPSSTNQGLSSTFVGAVPNKRGQAIIAGKSNSFQINGNEYFDLSENPVFFVPNTTIEFVCYFERPPGSEYGVIYDADTSGRTGIYVDSFGIKLRLMFTWNLMDTPIEVVHPIYDWARKYHVVVTFSEDRVSLSVNGERHEQVYQGEPQTNITSLRIGAKTLAATDVMLLDGLGVYKRRFTDKSDYVNSTEDVHYQTVSALGGGQTQFTGYDSYFKASLSSTDFFNYAGDDTTQRINYLHLPPGEKQHELIVVKCNNETKPIDYSVDGGFNWKTFTEKTTIYDVTEAFVFRYSPQPSDPMFSISVECISSSTISFLSPARLEFKTSSLVNPSFEYGTNYWGTYQATAELSTERSKTGWVSVKLTPTGGFGSSNLGSELVSVTDASTVTVEGWLYSEPQNDIGISISWWGSGGYSEFVSEELSPLIDVTETGWYRFKSTFTKPSNAVFVHAVAVVPSDSSKPIWVDGIYLYKDDKRGTIVFPSAIDDALVNCPDGLYLKEVSASGLWQTNDKPKSIEITFKPALTSGTVSVFSDSNGSVECGVSNAISGYTAYLNGSQVSNMAGVLWDQWNHLVLTRSSNTADTFSINGNNNTISYLNLAAFPSELSAASVATLFASFNGSNSVSYVETSGVINEGDHSDSGTPFRIYSYSWAIVGAGGS